MNLVAALFLALQAVPSPQPESLFGPPEPVRTQVEDAPIVCVRDGNTLQMNTCAMEDLEAEEARMERYLALALERAAETDAESGEYGEPTRQVELLAAAQKAWAAYADVRCEAQWDTVKGGTIRTIVLLSCRIDATRQRTHDIWADHLTFWDSTPPLLPEPTKTVRAEQADVAAD
jgi:uncharacterized protein YecT (DUF1311 family)